MGLFAVAGKHDKHIQQVITFINNLLPASSTYVIADMSYLFGCLPYQERHETVFLH